MKIHVQLYWGFKIKYDMKWCFWLGSLSIQPQSNSEKLKKLIATAKTQVIHFHEEQIHSSQAVHMDGGYMYKWRLASIGSEILPHVELTIISFKWNFELIENTAASFKVILASDEQQWENSDGRTAMGDKPALKLSLVRQG